MAYQINKTDGTIVSTVADGQVDTLSTDLTLIGKNYSGFGEALNENFIKVLENFANATRPTHPIRGQIWFDTSESRLKVYNGTEFIPVSSATISATQPSTLGVGDLWFNNIDKQLFFYDGTSPILLAPAYSASQGKSGFEIKSILDTLNQTRVVTYLYNNGTLLGIFAKDSFTPKSAIAGFTGNIQPGFNAGTIDGFKFNATATNAEQLGGAPATTYVRKDTSNKVTGQLQVSTDLGIMFGENSDGMLIVNSGNVLLVNQTLNKNIIFNVRKDLNQEDAIKISGADRTIDLYVGPTYTNSQVNVGGNLSVAGDLTVEGNMVTVNTQTVVIEDKNLVLAKSTGITPTDTNASGGGIILQGASSHVFLWSELNQSPTLTSSEAIAEGYNDSLPKLLSTAWNSSDHINLATGKYFAIDGIPVLTGNALGAGITSIPGVTSFGRLSELNVGLGSQSDPNTIHIEDNIIATQNPALPNLELDTLGDVVLNGTSKIKNLAAPTLPADATNKQYVDSTIRTRSLAFSLVIPLDINGFPTITNSYITQYILPNLAPVSEYDNGTYARIFCQFVENSTSTVDINSPLQAGKVQDTFLLDGGRGSAAAIKSLSLPSISVPAQIVTPTQREIRVFRIVGGAWTLQPGTIDLP